MAIVGHRRDKLPVTADPQVGRAISAVLRLIAEAVAEHHVAAAAFYRDETPLLTLYSGLAEGADRLGAAAALADPRWRLHAVLPFAADQYRADFEGPAAEARSGESFTELLTAASMVTALDGHSGRWDAYVPLARTLVDAADLLIAVWDGAEPAGPGGTGNVVRLARNEDVPVVRITPDPLAETWLEEMLDRDHGRAIGLSRLSERIHGLLQPPAVHQGAERWFGETGGPRRIPYLFDAVIRGLARWQGARPLARSAAHAPLAADPGVRRLAEWQHDWPELPPEIAEPLVVRFGPQFGWADELGRWYAAAFRSSFSAVFLLAVASVVTGGLLHLQSVEARTWLGVIIPVLEPILLGFMLAIVWRARSRGYHERWLDYRSLAERTRHLATLWPLARTGGMVRIPVKPLRFDPRLGWVEWLVRASAREAGLVTGNLDGAYSLSARQMVLRREASEQRAFHAGRRIRLQRLSGPLEVLAERLVGLALLLAFLRLFGISDGILAAFAGGDRSHGDTRAWVIIGAVATGLPALAAGIHGFLGIADFEGTAMRSAAIEGRLAELEGRLHRLDPVDLGAVADLTVEMTRSMEGELGAWHSATASRRLQAN